MTEKQRIIGIQLKPKSGLRANIVWFVIVSIPHKGLQHWVFRRVFQLVAEYDIVREDSFS